MQSLSFCVHNVARDTQKLDFFLRFSGYIFSKMLKIPILFVRHVYVCPDKRLIN